MQNENELSDETMTLDEPVTLIHISDEKPIKAEKCCSECDCTGYDQDHDNICKCGHNSEKHTC
jgi:hypothetical protein